MLRPSFVFASVFLVLADLASAQLPETEVVQQAYYEASSTLEDVPEVTAKAYFGIVLAGEATTDSRTKLVHSVAYSLRRDFYEIGISGDVEDACFFHFWQAVAAHYPDEEAFKTTILASEVKQLPWVQAQAKLLARGDSYALGLGLDRLVDSPESSTAMAPFLTAVADYMAQASSGDISKFLWFGDKVENPEIFAAIQQRFLEDNDPEIQALAATPAVRKLLSGQAVR